VNVISRSELPAGSVPARAWADVDLQAVEHNVRRIGELVAPAGVMAVVKADGYGHGAVQVSRAALRAGAARLAVATLREAAELRRAGIAAPIQILGVILDGNEGFLVELGGAVATVSTMDEAERLARAARSAGNTAAVHLKLDTGMHRLGAAPEEAERLARFLHDESGLIFEGAMTHFAAAGADADYTRKQMRAFDEFVEWLEAEGLRPPIVHAANSATLALHPEARYDMVRPGLAIYGIADPPELGHRLDLRPAMRLCARVVHVKRLAAGEPVGYNCTWRAPRESVVATASIGYADGLRTSLSNRGQALIRGRRVPVVGRVSMDFSALDVTDLGEVTPGEEVVFFGRQGEAEITAAECAANMGAIPYELICGVSFRVWRITR
jgi:alanine racemase